MANYTLKGQQRFHSHWTVQPSGNLKRIYPIAKVILRKREDGYEIHTWKDNQHFICTRRASRNDLYWDEVLDGIAPFPATRVSLRNAKLFTERHLKDLP